MGRPATLLVTPPILVSPNTLSKQLGLLQSPTVSRQKGNFGPDQSEIAISVFDAVELRAGDTWREPFQNPTGA